MTEEVENKELTTDSEAREALTDRDRFFYRKGFMVAMNFLYFHHETEAETERPDDDKMRFERFLRLHIDGDAVDQTLLLRSGGGNCRPGTCEVGGRCVLCKFRFAFDPENFT